jgi:nitroimidazol reductase NimA-like FMN-containing flavoprotein (pyridoxamine 5'-phosphate oxidase superfamily)
VTFDPRLETAPNIWLATVRPDGRPHLIPIWFVTDNGHWYICTGSHSVKARNLQVNPHVALALEDGTQAYVVEGQARPVNPEAEIVRKFKAKYDWDITSDSSYDQVYEIEVTRQVMGQS